MYKQLLKIIDHCENKTNNHAISVPLFILLPQLCLLHCMIHEDFYN